MGRSGRGSGFHGAAAQPNERQIREIRMVWKGPIAAFMRDETRIIDLEGAIRSGKTTACVWKVFNRLQEEPGLCAFLCRWTDGDTDSKLRPVWRAVCDAAGITPKWNPDEQFDLLPNGSRAYIFGLKSADQVLRYSKLRGLTVAVIYNDQTEELPHDIFLELCGRLSQQGFRHQAIFSPNPTSPDHWLKDEFPSDNRYPGRSYLHLSIYDNSHNLAPGTIEGVLAAFPPGHAKHRPMVLGLRGLNVIGVPCYKDAFDRSRHEKALVFNPEIPLCEGYDFGKHHPCWVVAQFPLGGGMTVLGGVMGQNLWLEDFLPLVQQCRQQWFGTAPQLLTCCDPAGTHDHAHGTRDNALQVLKRFYPEGHKIDYRENSNAPDVRIALVERLAGHMRRRTPWGESFVIDGTKDLNGQYVRWLRVDKDGAEPWSFVSDGCEAGYVWDSHFVSVGSKQMRKPRRDGWYEHGQACYLPDTEVLTDTGWVPFQQLEDISMLATVNIATNELQYQRPSRLIANEHQGLVRCFADRIRGGVTLDHRMVVTDRQGEEPQMLPAAECRPGQYLKLMVDPQRGWQPEYVYLDPTPREELKRIPIRDWVELMAWIVTEGTVMRGRENRLNDYRVIIAQMKPEHRERIEALLQRLPWSYSRGPRGFTICNEQLWREMVPITDQLTRRLPLWLRWLSAPLIEHFLDVAILGDGTVKPGGGRVYTTASRLLADDIQELFFKIGRSASITVRPSRTWAIKGLTGQAHEGYLVHEWRKPASSLHQQDGRPSFTDHHYEGMVYCATVPNGTLVVRREGRPFVCGNCLEYLELNFGGAVTSEAEEQQRQIRLREQQQRQRDSFRPMLTDPGTSWMS